MDKIERKKFNNNQTEKIRAKKIVPIRQILIRKNGTKVFNITKEKNETLAKKENNSIFHKSAILNEINNKEASIIKDTI